MRITQWTALLILVTTLSGCGSTSQPVPTTSHQGVMNELPGKKGYFEIRAKGGAGGGRSARSTKKVENTIVVHFYGTDGTTAMSPAPTDVTIKIGTGDSTPVVPLSPQSEGGFASAPGQFPSAFRGSLIAKIGGEPVEAAFMIR